MDKQAGIIADELKLPKPEAQIKTDPNKLAFALTKIEVENFEKVTGEKLSEKTFESLVQKNTLQTYSSMKETAEQIEQIQENFSRISTNRESDVISTTKVFSSALEIEAFNALLDPQALGFDENKILQTQEYVKTNEEAARETATLVQLAYGGQGSSFTDDFNRDLTDQLYYSPTPAVDVYKDFRQLDWQKTIEAFAPIVSSVAEQYKIEIKPPENEIERNKLLADFITEQLIKAYENQNDPMEKYVQNQLAETLKKTCNFDVAQPQKNFIAENVDKNLEPPEFKNRLEANAYNITKYDEDKRAEKAEDLADQIREQASKKIEKQAKMDIQEELVFSR